MVQKTPCWMANNAVGQEKQRDHIIQKANILSFQGPIPLFALNSARCLLYQVAVFCKGPIVHKFLGKRINFSFLLDIIKILKGCMDEMRTIDSSGDVNYFFISKVIRH